MKYLKSKTVSFGLLLTVLGAVQMYLPSVQQMMTPEAYGMATFAVGVIVVVLRAVTVQSLDQK